MLWAWGVLLQRVAQKIPDHQKARKQGQVGRQGSGTDMDDQVAKSVHYIEHTAQDRRGQYGFGQLLADVAGEKEGVEGAQHRVYHRQKNAQNQFEYTQQQTAQ